MKILIETCLDDFLLILIKDEKIIYLDHKEKLQKKADYLPTAFAAMLNELKIKTTDLSDIYVTNGPGSFMGARSGLIFAKTISSLTDINLYVSSSLKFISGITNNNIAVDAKSGLSYVYDSTKDSIELLPTTENSVIDYKSVIAKIKDHLSVFNKVNNLEDVEPLYVKEPNVG